MDPYGQERLSLRTADRAADRPVLVYDGECEFCCVWVDYWRQLTGGGVEYVPLQEVGERFPQVPREDFAAAVTLIAADGDVRSGAQAVFTLLARVPARAWMLWAYEHVPLAGVLSEAAYGLAARHRPMALRITRLLWGVSLTPETFAIAPGLILRALAVIYAIAFVSFGVQISGLIGSHGLLPVAELLPRAGEVLGASAYWLLPTLFWLDASDFTLRAACMVGVLLAALLFFGIAKRAVCAALFLLYLSLVVAGQDFMEFQWDALLLEAGFLAIFLNGSSRITWLFRWLLFRLVFLSGAVKLLSGDPAWRALAALGYHYETQPLPTLLAWYMHQLPLEIHKLEAVATFTAELVVPFLFFAPRRLRHAAALATVGFQAVIFATGNYTFFNLLTAALCLSLLDDAFLRPVLSRYGRAKTREMKAGAAPRRWHPAVATTLATFILLVSGYQLAQIFLGVRLGAADYVLQRMAALRIVNTYGLFAVMTTSRPEIVLEGSNDGLTWQEYEFRYKPGDLQRRPAWAQPHQPRLDWQMWFAALGRLRDSPWLVRLVERLLEGEPEVLDLLEKNPFPGAPPKYVRALLYEYRFSTPTERRQTGAWWKRELKGTYLPAVSLKSMRGQE